jgi:hypothetical protein
MIGILTVGLTPHGIFNKIMYAADHNPHRVEQVVDSIPDLVRLTGLKLVFVVFVLSTEYLGILLIFVYDRNIDCWFNATWDIFSYISYQEQDTTF